MAEESFYQLYIAQNGASITTVVLRSTLEKVQGCIHEGRPFGIWMKSEGKRLTGLTINPMAGGVTLSSSPALRIPLTKQGAIAKTEGELDKYLEPKDQSRGELSFPDWRPRMGLRAEEQERAAPTKQPMPEVESETEEPPGPPS